MPFDRRLILCVNWALLGLALLLFGIGVLNLYSASGFRMGDIFRKLEDERER